ncbi:MULTISPECIES: DUF2059 domain-containing protein [Methylobacterium]|jgi:hypothetical protein|uniref:DUF2059 domain-containing protein n=3 Tax=Methylobacterium TaxID=407 RepID=A0AAE8HQ67_9HYPH|nr:MULTISPECIES: DUF2059 domain-containing protein [Methylobacterium]AIQ90820.1 protein of unassigned function [Methylobacterium oryzae CBMB20]APT31432.1 hypothetical protein MCBMB27_02141 [Methylobacterium phyllosphaerae]AWV17210.1 hypothetical protein A3862_18265 [Methylobacterium sp. XJLW]MBA9061777.1 hypothetical protein [Methylobacterium fujisawaense]MBP30673.1 DUF2059 domain-containing protein [Methylobacterium sp.]
MSRRLIAAPGLALGLALLALPHPAAAQPQKPAPTKPTAQPNAPAGGTPAANTPAASTFSPSHLALAREVMLSSGIARSFDSVLPAFADQIRKQTVTRPELSKDLEEVLASLQPEMELQKQRMIDIAARTYASKFSEAELKEIATFFRSPAGKHYVEAQPQLLDEMVQEMQDWTQDVSEYVMVRVRAEMGKRGHQMQ